MNRRQSFWEQLKRRNVPRTAAFYAGSAWLLVQVATQVFPFFDVPNWAVRWVVIASILGFPFALLFSWFYELTPQGLKRESELQADASIPRSSGRTMDRWIIGVLGLAVIVLLATLFTGGLDRVGTPAIAADKSVAVLPFESLSDDKANAYFAQGIQDEILTRLAKIGALRVISRTSTARYASNPDDLQAIAKKLGVDHVLEGSVQKSGDTVHINVQLIRVATDEHLWAETYNRKLDDIFSVEGEVAQAIAEALKAKLTGEEHQAVSQVPTQNATAYDLYLRGLSFELRFVDSQQDYAEAARYMALAVKADPGFALAWAHLAINKSFDYLNGMNQTPQSLAELRNAAQTAMQLQPELGESWLARGYYLYRGLGDFQGAIVAFQEAAKRLPNNAEVSAAIAYALRRQGKWEESLTQLQTAAQRDPQNLSYWFATAENYAALRRFDLAQHALDQTLDIAQDRLTVERQKLSVYLNAGELDPAQKLVERLSARDQDIGVVNLISEYRLLRHDYAPMRALLEQRLAHDGVATDDAAGLYLLLGAAIYFGGDPSGSRPAFEESRRRLMELRSSGADRQVSCKIGVALAALGQHEAALAEGRHCLEIIGDDRLNKPQAEVELAKIYTMAGERDAAFALLAQLPGTPNGLTPGDLRYQPIWDPLRDDPRFKAVLDKVAQPLLGRP